MATYFGFASEAREIREQNQNLDFDIALLPQTKGAKNKTTYAKMQAFSLMKTSQNTAQAFLAVSALTDPASIFTWSRVTGLPPVRRDVLREGSSDVFGPVLYDSAIRSRAWLDPNRSQTTAIFRTMVESSLSGREGAGQSLTKADKEMKVLIEGVNEKNNEE